MATTAGRSPKARSLAQLKSAIAAMKEKGVLVADYVGIPHGSLSVTVPGAVDGWYALHERWGRLTMGEVLEQAHTLRE